MNAVMTLSTPADPFDQNGLTLIPAWISDHMPRKGWEEIAYPLSNFNPVEVWELINKLTPHFTGLMIIFMLVNKLSVLVKGAHVVL